MLISDLLRDLEKPQTMLALSGNTLTELLSATT
jgi:hypothetical protein